MAVMSRAEAEWQKRAAPWRVRGMVYSAYPILNFRVKPGGEFVDLTTNKEIKLGDAKDRITAHLRFLDAQQGARQAMPTAPVIPPPPRDEKRPEEAAEAIRPFGAPQPVLIPSAAPVPAAPPVSGGTLEQKWSGGGGRGGELEMTSASSQPVLVINDGESEGKDGASGSVVGGIGLASSLPSVPVLLGIGALALLLFTSKRR